jgi:hypothetical protein
MRRIQAVKSRNVDRKSAQTSDGQQNHNRRRIGPVEALPCLIQDSERASRPHLEQETVWSCLLFSCASRDQFAVGV